MLILAIDIDDSLLPSNSNYFGTTDDALQMFEINLKRLEMIANKYECMFYMLSDWTIRMLVKDKEIKFVTPIHKTVHANQRYEKRLIKMYLSGRMLDVKDLNKRDAIKELLNEGHTVISLDDEDLSDVIHDRHLHCNIKGFINGNVGYNIKNFLS